MLLERDIISSVQVPELIKDEIIKQGNVCLDKRGRPLHYSGGFALVFPFDVNGNKWAFRCWKADLGNIERRNINTNPSANLPFITSSGG